MGYRLDVRTLKDNKCIYYGSKLYGYIEEETEKNLLSYKYLLEIKKFDGTEYFDYCNSNEVELTFRELIEFLVLYKRDFINFAPFSKGDGTVFDDLIDLLFREYKGGIQMKCKYYDNWCEQEKRTCKGCSHTGTIKGKINYNDVTKYYIDYKEVTKEDFYNELFSRRIENE